MPTPNQKLFYKEYHPHPDLRDRIECYWKFSVGRTLDQGAINPLHHVFPPDGSCNLLFVKSPKHKAILFAGPSTRIREITIWPDTVFFGIKVKPGCSNWLYQADPGSLKNASVTLSTDQSPDWQKDLLTRLASDLDDVAFLDEELLSIKKTHRLIVDDRVAKAIQLMIEHDGNVTTEEVSDSVCMSTRNLQRIFLKSTGITIKKFAQLRRLRKAIIDMYVDRRNRNEMVETRGYSDPAQIWSQSSRRSPGSSFRVSMCVRELGPTIF